MSDPTDDCIRTYLDRCAASREVSRRHLGISDDGAAVLAQLASGARAVGQLSCALLADIEVMAARVDRLEADGRVVRVASADAGGMLAVALARPTREHLSAFDREGAVRLRLHAELGQSHSWEREVIGGYLQRVVAAVEQEAHAAACVAIEGSPSRRDERRG